MLFGATYACPSCMLRFAKRARCPSCDGAVVSLADRAGRTAVRGGKRASGGGRLRFALAQWAPSRPWIPIAIGIAMMLPALATPFLGPTWLLDTWLVDDRGGAEPRLSIEHRGLSWRGIQILAIGGAGLLLAALSIVATLGRRRGPPAPAKKLRLHACEAERGDDDGATTITGVARAATVELESPLGGEACLVAGLRGEVDGEEVDDADGGDFDVVTEEGAVVMVSLEHARLEPRGDEVSIELTGAEAVELEPFLAERVGQRVRERCKLAETIVATGDTVRVTGRLSGPALAAAPFRDDPRGRVLIGEADRPIVIRIVKRAAAAAAS